MDRIGQQGGNNLSARNENSVSGPQFTWTHDGLGAKTVILTVMLEIVEDLGTRDYADGG